MARTTTSAIPVGTQFSPGVLDLSEFLKAVVAHSGDKSALEKHVWKAPVRLAPPAKAPTKRRASLPLEAAVQYGLLQPRTYEATDLARHLATLSGKNLYEQFAQHILFRLGGLRVVEGVQQMQAENLNVTGDTLASYLSDQGFRVTEHNTAINSMRMWLAQAGLFPERGWQVDDARKELLLGLSDATIAALASLTEEQRAFVLALCAIDPPGKHPAADIRNLAEANTGLKFDRASLPKAVLQPLADIGLITYETKGTAGGKTATLKTTSRFKKEVLTPFLETAVRDLDAVLTDYFQQNPADIYAQLNSTNTYEKGRALEAYAIRVMRLLRFRFIGWRKRAKDSGYSEVDVVMTRVVGGVPTRWQVQCKNTPRGKVDLEDVAKEVGISPLTKATHLLFIANCDFTRDARRYANEVMVQTPLTIYLLDKRDFESIKKSEGSLAGILDAKAREANALKRGETMWGF